MPLDVQEEFPHYYKEIPTHHIDVYRVLRAYNITDPALQHAIKKLLVSGNRGSKDVATDVSEAIASLRRYQSLQTEDRDYANAKLAAAEARAREMNTAARVVPVHGVDLLATKTRKKSKKRK